MLVTGGIVQDVAVIKRTVVVTGTVLAVLQIHTRVMDLPVATVLVQKIRVIALGLALVEPQIR